MVLNYDTFKRAPFPQIFYSKSAPEPQLGSGLAFKAHFGACRKHLVVVESRMPDLMDFLLLRNHFTPKVWQAMAVCLLPAAAKSSCCFTNLLILLCPLPDSSVMIQNHSDFKKT